MIGQEYFVNYEMETVEGKNSEFHLCEKEMIALKQDKKFLNVLAKNITDIKIPKEEQETLKKLKVEEVWHIGKDGVLSEP